MPVESKIRWKILHLGFLYLAFICPVILGDCSFSNKTYNEGDIWDSEDNCEVYECSNSSEVIVYNKVCPHVPACIASQLYTKNCCLYCNEGSIPTEDNGDASDGYRTHACKRDCISGENMSCKYTLTSEILETMSDACFDCPYNLDDCDRKGCILADGIHRLITVVNRMLPGPAIEVCVNDTIVVDLVNAFTSQGTTLHWHGIPQKGSQYSDGAHHITQCPVTASNTYRYVFTALDQGTYFYHSHFGLHLGNGMHGPLIIRQPVDENPYANLYDIDDRIMVVSDWSYQYEADQFYAHYMTKNSDLLIPNNFLINGRGRLLSPFNLTILFASSDGEDMGRFSIMPLTEFVVKQGTRYRFRIIDAASSDCPVAISIDNHTMTIISADGFDVEPVEVERLIASDAERYDFILDANQPVDKYWIRAKAILLCMPLQLQQLAVLRYEGASDGDPTSPTEYNFSSVTGRQFSSVSIRDVGDSNNTILLTDLRSVQPLEPELANEPDQVVYVELVSSPALNTAIAPSQLSFDPDNQITFQFNNISFTFPDYSLLTQPHTVDPAATECNETSLREQNMNCSQELCSCMYIINIELNSLVEVILFDPLDLIVEHPIHLHGYTFRVLGMDRVPNISEAKLREMDQNGELKRNFDNPVQKDTVSVYSIGYTIFRFYAENPGIWLMHCHIEFHLAIGMALLFRVGHQSDLPPIPTGLPQCHSYKPH